jgi:Flp pilus assembly protein TadG
MMGVVGAMIGGARFRTALGRRRGTVAVMTALMLPALLGAAAMAVDLGIWFRETERLQLAADAGAEGAARLLPLSTTGTSAYQAAALIEVNGVTGGTTIGTLQTPVTVSVGTNWSSVTVTLHSKASSYLAGALGFSGPSLSATATATAVTTTPATCVLALSGSAAPAIQVDNMGSIVASGCPIFSDSTASTSIYLNSGTIKGTAIGSAGVFGTSNSGSNTVSPTSPSNYQTSQSDPDSGLSLPSFSTTCNGTNSFAGNHTFSPTTFCGNVSIIGNGGTATFNSGTYYIVNGSITFSNATVAPATGVTFVLTGTSPGTFTWTNNSNGTIAAPGTGALAGILIWQTKPCTTSACTAFSSCASSCSAAASCSNVNAFAGGSTLQASGAIYTPCSGLDLSNGSTLKTATGGGLAIVSQTIYATGSGSSLATSPASSGSTPSVQYVLTQ